MPKNYVRKTVPGLARCVKQLLRWDARRDSYIRIHGQFGNLSGETERAHRNAIKAYNKMIRLLDEHKLSILLVRQEVRRQKAEEEVA